MHNTKPPTKKAMLRKKEQEEEEKLKGRFKVFNCHRKYWAFQICWKSWDMS